MKLKIFTLVGLALTFSACSKDRNNNAPTVVDPIVVQPSDVSTCTVKPGRFKCDLNGTSTTEGQVQFRSRVVIKETRRGGRTINVDNFTYRADGTIHQGTTELGNRLDYSVTCVGDMMEINARGAGTPVAAKLHYTSLNSRRANTTVVLRTMAKEIHASGTCTLSR